MAGAGLNASSSVAAVDAARTPVARRRAAFAAAALICLVVFGVSFVLGPRSCDGGFGIYFWVGVAALVLLLALPFVARLGRSWLRSAAWSVGLVAIGLFIWIAGLEAGHFRILCRLF